MPLFSRIKRPQYIIVLLSLFPLLNSLVLFWHALQDGGGLTDNYLAARLDFAQSSSSSAAAAASFQQQPNEEDPIPIVIICALRPQYLQQLLQSLKNQIATTPVHMAQSTRYLFIHQHERNNKDPGKLEKVTQLATEYGLQVHTFNGLEMPQESLSLNANFAWYKMMAFLFDDLHVTQALVVEEDIALAPDALVMAAKLFQHKAQRTDVHSICLGGWGGYNRINADPYTFLAARTVSFQPMAYSMDRSLFHHLRSKKMAQDNKTSIPDWTEEITKNNFVQNLTHLSPSVSRMRHIGVEGMGPSGNGSTREALQRIPWEPWNSTINKLKTTHDLYLDPPEVTDVWGYVCDPFPRVDCGYRQNLAVDWFGNVTVAQRKRTRISAESIGGERVKILSAKASSIQGRGTAANFAIDGDLGTRWASKSLNIAWIVFDLGRTQKLASVQLFWESAYAEKYLIQTSNDGQNWTLVHDETQGKGAIELVNVTGASGRFVRLYGTKRRAKGWGYSLWEVEVRAFGINETTAK